MAIKKNTPAINLPSTTLQQLASNTGGSGSITSAKAQVNAPVKNDYNFIVNGKIPTTLTFGQLKSLLGDSVNNAPAIQRMALDVANVPGALGDLKTIATDGKLSAIDQTYLGNYALGLINNNKSKDPVSIADAVTNKINPQSINPYAVSSKINLQNIDRPDINAVKSTVNDLYLSILGKSASDAESEKWAQVYDKYAAANPTSQTIGSNTYSLTAVPNTTTGGTTNRLLRSAQNETTTANQLNLQDFVKNKIIQSGDYKAYQASGAAFNLLSNMAAKDSGVV
jgi:hypothetical protein